MPEVIFFFFNFMDSRKQSCYSAKQNDSITFREFSTILEHSQAILSLESVFVN